MFYRRQEQNENNLRLKPSKNENIEPYQSFSGSFCM